MKKLKKGMKKIAALLLSTILCISSLELQTICAKEPVSEEVAEQMVSGDSEWNTVTEEGESATVSGQEEFSSEDVENSWDGVTRESTYEADNYKITFSITGAWEGGFNASVKVENTSDEVIHNWYLKMLLKNQMSNIWNAEVADCSEREYLIKNAGWNQDILSGGSVEFGFSGGESFIGFPQLYELQSSKAETESQGYEVEYITESDWGSGFTGKLVISNTSEKALEDWVLEFDFPRTIDTIWNGIMVSQLDNHYVIQNADYNANINAGESVTVGFTGRGGNSTDNPTNYQLYSYKPISAGMENLNLNEDYLKVNAAYSQVEIGYQEADTAESVTKNLNLPEEINGISVEWSSSNEAYVKSNGEVTRPDNKSEKVTLTATIKSNDYFEQKEFDIYVIKNTYVDYNTDYIEDMESPELFYRYNGGDLDNLEVYLKEDKTIQFISGSFSDMIVESPEEAILSLYGIKSLMGSKSPKDELKWVSTNKDKYGTSFRFLQVYKGIPIYGTSIVVSTNADGYTAALQSSFVKDINISTTPNLSKEEAVVKLEKLGLKVDRVDKLYVYMDGENPKLAWNIYAVDGQEIYNCLVDANNGEELLRNLVISYESASGTTMGMGKSLLGETKTFPVTYYMQDGNMTFVMKDGKRNISVYDMKGSQITDINLGTQIKKWYNTWVQTEVSAYTNTMKAYDYYYEHFGRRGFDNAGSEIKVGAYWGEDYSCNLGEKLFFGSGGTYNRNGAAAVDTVAHEYTHGVIACTTGLVSYYWNEPGAINEGYADIFGEFIEGKNGAEWLHREDNTKNARAIRNLSNPSEFHQPSKIGDSYYYDYVKKGSKDDRGGVHKNNTIVSHACYLMWEKGLVDKDRLADLWYHSLLLGYDKNSEFKSVRLNVLTAAKHMQMSDGEIKIIESAFDEVRVGSYSMLDILGTNIVTGKVVQADLDTALGNNQPLQNVSVKVARYDFVRGVFTEVKPSISTKTQSDGIFNLNNLVPGTYQLTVSKDGYYTTTQMITLTETKLNNYCSTIELIPTSYSGNGNASGVIKDSVTGVGVEGLTLTFRSGINNKEGMVADTKITQKNGVYEVSGLPTGHYCVEVSDNRGLKNGEQPYYKTYFNIKILGGYTIGNQNATVSNVLGASQLRIVLEWGINPRDLDSHLIGPTSIGRSFEIYYGNKRYEEKGTLVADLDLDDTTSYGPETTTIYKPIEGIYTFYVYHFAGSGSLSTSGASVKVYTGDNNEPAYVFNVPANQAGYYWTVFTYNSKTKKISPINSIGSNVIR